MTAYYQLFFYPFKLELPSFILKKVYWLDAQFRFRPNDHFVIKLQQIIDFLLHILHMEARLTNFCSSIFID